MDEKQLFALALGLQRPWFVASCSFDAEEKQLDLHLDFEQGARFPCPSCGRLGCAVHDTFDKQWRHLNFFEHRTYLHARTPRTECDQCGVKLVRVPWSRPDSGFTLLFDALVMMLAKQMPVEAIARLVGEHDTRLWRVLHHYTEEARSKVDMSDVTQVGMDETSSKRGHHYVSIFVDLDERGVLFATEGRQAATVDAFKEDLQEHGGDAASIREVSCDMSPAFISGVGKNFENAQITFDKYHVTKIVNDAVDDVRRQEQKERPDLKGTRYVWLKNQDHLTDQQAEMLGPLVLPKLNLKTARAYQIKLNFQELWEQEPEDAEAFLKKWYFWATHSRLEPMIEAAKTIKRHWDGVLRWFVSRINNGILEGINSLVQAAKAKARGYRSVKNFITMVYIVAGKLDFGLPT